MATTQGSPAIGGHNLEIGANFARWGERLEPSRVGEIAMGVIGTTHRLTEALNDVTEPEAEPSQTTKKARREFTCKALGARITLGRCVQNVLDNLGQPCGLDCPKGWRHLETLGVAAVRGGSVG